MILLMRMFFKQYVKEMAQLGVNSIGIVLSSLSLSVPSSASR
jgi:hypothetical protein